MKGNEVNRLRELESLVSQDDGKSLSYVSTKLSVFNVAYHNFEASFLKNSGDNENEYDFIPFQSGCFVDMLIEASVFFKMDRTKKFLDVGSGPGTKVMLASVLFDAFGVELRKDAVDLANQFGLKNVFQGNALEFKNYGDYDLLYFYRPLKSPPLQLALEEMIFDQMKPGALIAPMHTEFDWDTKTKRVSEYLYLKEK